MGDIDIDQTSTRSVHQDGPIAYLTEDQFQSFSVFKDNLMEAKLYKPAIDDNRASHDDTTLLYACFFYVIRINC
jgi:hypothetical protein